MIKVSELREKSINEIEKSIVELRKEQSDLRMQGRSGRVARHHIFSELRHNIARMKTVISEKRKAEK